MMLIDRTSFFLEYITIILDDDNSHTYNTSCNSLRACLVLRLTKKYVLDLFTKYMHHFCITLFY